jgi:hypothetical protein
MTEFIWLVSMFVRAVRWVGGAIFVLMLIFLAVAAITFPIVALFGNPTGAVRIFVLSAMYLVILAVWCWWIYSNFWFDFWD